MIIRLAALAFVSIGFINTPAHAQTLGDLNKPQTEALSDSDIEIKPVKIVEPKAQPREIEAAAIDTERFELGVFAGVIAVEDFNSNLVYGLSGSFHVSKNWLVQVNYGRSEVSRATIEDVTDSNFLSEDDRDLSYFDVTAGYQLLPGRSYASGKSKFNSGIYLLAGAGQSEFAGSKEPTFNFGASYRVVVTDWMTMNLDFRDRLIQREYLGEDKLSHNLEATLGINALF